MLTIIVVGTVAFIAGGVFGALNERSVERAINSLKEAEANAQAVVAKIAAHKAS